MSKQIKNQSKNRIILKNNSQRKNKLTIAHIHVWDKKNKGDYAIVLAVQELLKNKFSGVKILDFPVEVLKSENETSLKKINSADLVFIGGGGIFYSYFLPFNERMIKAIKKPIYLFGLGYIKEVDAPLWPKKNITSVLTLARQAALVGVRDLNTRRFLIKNGLAANKIKVIGDPAALLKEQKLSEVKIKKLKLNSKKIKIGLNLNYSGWLGFGCWREDILNAYKEVIRHFLIQGAEIYYLKHHPGEESIYRELGVKNIIKIDLSPAEQKYVYSQMDMIIGMMLHVGVMSFGALTPEISVAYDIRNYGFAEFIRAKELVVDLEKLKEGELLKRAKKVFAQKEAYKAKFKKEKQKIKEKEERFLHLAWQKIQ